MARQSVLSEGDIAYARQQIDAGVSLTDVCSVLASRGVRITRQGLRQRLAATHSPPRPPTSEQPSGDLADEMARCLRMAEAAERSGDYRDATAAVLAYARLAAQVKAAAPPEDVGPTTVQAALSAALDAEQALRMSDPESWAREELADIRRRYEAVLPVAKQYNLEVKL